MKKFINSCCIAVLICVLSIIASAQRGSSSAQGVITLNNDVAVAIKTETSPSGGSENSYGNIYSSSTKNVIHRIMTDRKNKTYFGYDLSVEKLEDSGKFRVSIRPLSKAPDMLVGKRAVSSGTNATAETRATATGVYSVGSGGSGNVEVINIPDYKDYIAQSLPNYPDDIIVEDGDKITLDLLENPATNTKISDVITVMNKTNKSSFVFSSGNSAKSFSMDDVYLKMETPDIFINDKKYTTNSSIAGNVNWIYVEGKGRFIFSYEPQPRFNFQKIGFVEDNKISFEFGGDRYQIVSKSPILGQGGKWNLWVMYDPTYQPTNKMSADSPFIFGAAGKVDFLFERR